MCSFSIFPKMSTKFSKNNYFTIIIGIQNSIKECKLGKLHQLWGTPPGPIFSSDKYGLTFINMAYFSAPNWNVYIRCLKLLKKIFFSPPSKVRWNFFPPPPQIRIEIFSPPPKFLGFLQFRVEIFFAPPQNSSKFFSPPPKKTRRNFSDPYTNWPGGRPSWLMKLP